MNETQSAGIRMELSFSERVEMFYLLSFFIVSTPINIYALMRTKRSKREGAIESRLIRLSRQLLIAHLMVLAVYGVWRVYWFYNIVWVQGNLMCKLFSFMCALPFHLWSNLVAAIAVDMLFCITSPLNSYRTADNRVTCLICISWGSAILCAMPMLVMKGTIKIGVLGEEGEYEQCYALVFDYSAETLIAFNVFHVMTTFYIPLLIVIVCYSAIGISLRRQMAERKSLHTGNSVQHLTVDSREGSRRVKHKGTETRFFWATAAIIATFVVTWLPYQVLSLIRVACDEEGLCQDIAGYISWLQAIIIASTCINPFLYRFGERAKKSKTSNVTETGFRTKNSLSLRRSASNSCERHNSDRRILRSGPERSGFSYSTKSRL